MMGWHWGAHAHQDPEGNVTIVGDVEKSGLSDVATAIACDQRGGVHLVGR